jgi:NADPH-dependent curcumin reductase CurA
MYGRHARGELTALVDDVRPGAPRFAGVEQATAAVAHMLAGRNVGKVVVRVAWDSTPGASL